MTPTKRPSATTWASGRQFVSSILWNGSGKFDDLLTSQTVYVNARMAKLYPDAVLAAAPADDNTFVAATWPASEGRSGLLTQPSYPWAQSDPALNSIVKRGKQLHDDVLCQDRSDRRSTFRRRGPRTPSTASRWTVRRRSRPATAKS